jgi:hypothetical protein
MTIEMTILLRERPRRFPCVRIAVCIVAVTVLGAETAAAQNCFLFFCPPGSQPDWQRTPVPDRQGEPARPFFSGPDGSYSTMYAESSGEPFPVPALRLSDVDPTYLRRSVYYPTNEPPGTIGARTLDLDRDAELHCHLSFLLSAVPDRGPAATVADGTEAGITCPAA